MAIKETVGKTTRGRGIELTRKRRIFYDGYRRRASVEQSPLDFLNVDEIRYNRPYLNEHYAN